ncbi:hypothetical protein AZL_d04230 (plasmid) [Azospirillum sp. B510]|uniref:Ig-like domain-containing protein n=2 Tax=Alphaproteobacteria TaxID=28211 RepID=UPI0001C4CFE4|nr:Ig-like domain-containing protein [Azospirillum sp. B510]BAI76249.1 hypothetical protein AZL_d04230 [Azospirillum sp. B510]
MSFTELLAQLMQGNAESEQKAAEGATAFGAFLNAQAQIRIYVDNTPNMGHQATTIHLLKRQIDRYGYAGQVRIVWAPAGTSKDGINDTARKLGLLLTGLDPAQIDTAQITYGTCQDIRFINLASPGDKLNDRVAFGMTGGADDLTVNYAEKLNVSAFLRLQPFAWRLENGSFVPNQIEFQPASGRATVRIGDLSDTINLLPYKFDKAAVTTVPQSVWDWYCSQTWNPALATSTGYARSLMSACENTGALIWPAYGLHQFDSTEMLLNIAIIAGCYQKGQNFLGAPIVVPLLNTFTDEKFTYVDLYKSADPKSTENLNKKIKDDYGYTNKNKSNFDDFLGRVDSYKTDNQASQRVSILRGDFTAEDITQKISALHTGDVLMVVIGSVPQDVYNCLFTAPLPPLFEGQGTSSLVISLGTPYFQMPKPGMNGNNYPSAPPVGQPAGIPMRCNETAALVRLGYNKYLTYPPIQKFGDSINSIISFMNDLRNAESELSGYFKTLFTYYSQDIHDKLTLGLIAYQSQTTAQQEPNAVALSARSASRLSAEAGSTATLAGIYDSLTAAWSDGTLDLLAAMAGSEFADFWRPVVGSTFLVTVALDDITETKDDGGAVTEVSVVNAGTLAFGTPFSLGLLFTAPNEGPILSTLSCRATQVWSIDGAPWIQFADPGFDLTVTEALTPVQGGLVGTVIGGATLTMEIRYPVEENRWIVTGVFAAPYPSIGSFFQMAGGLNLVQSLPSPLNALSGFGLREAQFVYDQTAAAIESLTFTFSTDSPWILLKDPAISLAPTIVYTISAPGDLENRSWMINATGDFTIGGGTVTISTQYPDFQVSGALTDGEIKIADLVKLLGAVLDVDAAITGFSFYVYPTTGFFGVSADAVLDAPVTIGGITLFKLDTLGVDTTGGDGRYAVTLRGTTVILPGTSAEFSLSLGATFELPDAWTFVGQQTDGTSVSLTGLLDYYLGWNTGDGDPYGIAGLALSFDTGTGAWSFAGGTAEPWSVPFIPDIKVAGRFSCGSRVPDGGGELESYGRIDLDWLWNGITLKVWYDYQPEVTSFGITWDLLSGTVTYDPKTGEYTTKLGFTDNVTIGSLIATMIEWLTGSSFTLEAPWDVVNQISLSGVSLVYVFNTKDSSRNRVSFDLSIGPLDLGFARIDSISASYLSQGKDRGVNVSLKGLFTWNIGDGAMGDSTTLGPWDASKPGAAPAPPGQGNKYLDLRMMALGQRVTVKGLTDATTVQDAIALMTTLPDPSPGTLPPLVFDAASDWMVGLDFGVLKLGEKDGGRDTGTGYFLTLQTVFNDPNFYALRLALDGSMAKVFKGLDFQIIYRQISDTVGVYSAQIALPTIMRRIDVGAYTITLPEFAISVYTNGDFQIDVGFPWNNDFSRSFTVEAIIPPGIPMLGSGGFYFGKLSSATTTLVPTVVNGTFNPVLTFGFGFQLGLGKSVEYGILSASFSLTVFGILEGVLATWNPYDGAGSTLPAGQLQGAYYFKLSGTLGISGKLDGSVDFGIIKASVSVEVMVMVQLSYESFVSMTFTVLASVKVKASVRINLGLFKITLHFSFSMRVKESFTVANTGSPPWQVAATTTAQTASLLSRPAALRTSALRTSALRKTAQPAARTLKAAETAVDSGPSWSNLLPADKKAPLSGYTAMGLTGARSEWPEDTTQTPCWVAMLFIDSVAPSDGTTTGTDTGDTAFETLAKAVARWVIAAMQPAPLTSDQVDALIIDETALDALLDTTLVSTDDNPTPIPIDAIDPFFDGQFVMTVALPPDEDGSATATYFPMPGAVTMTVPAYGADYAGVSYAFGDYNAISSAGLAELRAYFNALSVQSGESGDAAALAVKSGGTDDSTSMADWIRSDYMLLIARQMIQAMRDGLRDFTHPIDATTTPQALVASVNATGQLSGGAAVSVADLFTANPSHALAAGKPFGIGTSLTAPAPSPSFNDLALDYAADGVTGGSLAMANAASAGILAAGAVVSWPGHDPASYTVAAGDTLYAVADAFDALLADLLSEADVLDQPGLPASGALLLVPLITASALSGDSFTSIAGREPFAAAGLTASALALANAGNQILRTGAQVGYPDKAAVTVQPRQGLGDIAHSLGVSLDDLLAHGQVLTQTDLLATVAVLALPVLTIDTAEGDTLTDIAARYGTTPAALGDLPANAAIAGLFAVTDSSGADIGTLDLPHLPHYQVAALIDEAQRSQAIANLSGMASRYYLQGLRLPTDGITPKAAGMWVRDSGGTLTLPPFAGLFALTGQQIALPAAITATPFTVTLSRAAGPAWLAFADAAGTSVDSLTIEVAAGTPDANRITSIAACLAAPLDIPLLALGTGTVARGSPATYPLSSMTAWLSADLVGLPNGSPGDGNQTLRVWTLPDSLTALPDPSTRRIDPRFAVILSRYDEASGSTVDGPVGAYGWASAIAFTVRKVPAIEGSPASATTYEVIGADDEGIVILERLLDQLKTDDDAIASLRVAFVMDGGIQSDADAAVTMGISQANLSTQTNPPATMTARALTATASTGLGLLNSKLDFLRLLWEASITRSGGFYLYYYDQTDARGLPDDAFNDKGEASLTAMVLYAAPAAAARRNRLTDYMNAVVTGGGFDLGSAAVNAKADPQTDPLTVTATATDTLAGLAYGYFANPGDLAESNAGLALTAGTVLTVSQGLYQPPPGAPQSLDAIAARFGTSVAALQAANGGTLPDPASFPLAIRLPALSLTAGTSSHSGSLEEIAGWYGMDVVALAAHNRLVAGLWTGRTVVVPEGPVTVTSTVDVGTAALLALREVPPEEAAAPAGASDTAWATAFLLNDVSLLGCRIYGNADFTESPVSLPFGPTSPDDGGDDADTGDTLATAAFGKVAAPELATAGEPDWEFRQNIPYSSYARDGSGDSPYDGVGGVLQVTFSWQDLYGNQIDTTLSEPSAGSGGPFNQPPVIVGYTDALIGLGQWPTLSSNWLVDSAEDGGARITLTLSFAQASYDGLLMAVPQTDRTVLATFTQTLDPTSAANAANYSLTAEDGAVSLEVASAALQPGGLSVLLTLAGAFTDGDAATLTVNGLTTATGDGVSGWAGFSYPDTVAARGSGVQSSAAQAQRTYGSLRDQLNDPNGISLTVSMSLLVDEGGKPLVTALSADEVTALKQWLFDGTGGTGGTAGTDGTAATTSILAFVTDRAAFGTGVAAPPPSQQITLPVAASSLTKTEIVKLELIFTVTRTGGSVWGDLQSVPGIRSASTIVPPLTKGDSSSSLALSAFAAAMEEALSQPGGYLIRVATGTDRDASVSTADTSVWAVRVGETAGQAISYALSSSPDDPAIFAPRPVSNRLESRSGVPIYPYATGQGLSKTGVPTDFTNVDMDSWTSQLFAAVDAVLTPKFLPAIQILDKLSPGGRLEALLDYKDDLATITSELMEPVYADQADADPSNAREAFYQELLAQLSNAYTVKAALGFTAAVTGSTTGAFSGDEVPPRLYGATTVNPQMTAVTLAEASASALTVWFSTAMATDPAGSPGSYTLSGGLEVVGAVVASDGQSVTLTLNGDATAGTTVVTVDGALTDTLGWPIQAPLSMTVTSGAATPLASTLSLSAPKLSLETAPDQPLTIMVSAPGILHDDSGAAVSSVALNLRYYGSSIEHQIGSLSGIENYEASSWLSFVIAQPSGPLTADLGRFPVPMVLRSFPTTPDLPAQTATGTPQADADELSEILVWTLDATYSLPYHYPQDRVHATVQFNIATPLMAFASFLDAFNALAQFVTVFPSVQADLDSWLAGIDASIDAADAEGQLRIANAATALDSMLEMVGDIVEASGGGNSFRVAAASPSAGVGDPSLSYAFTVAESSVDHGQTRDALLVTIIGAPPAGIGVPVILVAPDLYEAVLISAPDGASSFSYVYRRRDGDDVYLSAGDGQSIADRTIELPGMNILQRQDAQTSVLLTRNEELVAGRPSAAGFVYTTPDVTFANPVLPSVSWDQAIDVAAIGGSGPVSRTLTGQLANLFATLLTGVTLPTLSIQVRTVYGYAKTSFATVELPVFMQAPRSVAIFGTGEGTLDAMIEAWTGAISLWFATNAPSGTGGRLAFDLRIMSDLTKQTMPLVHLSSLTLDLDYIDPPLTTAG